jgi:phenylalanyl-tRNA synthetase beta chain
MLVPLSWLKEYVDIDIPVELLAERLTLAGLEVGHIRYIGMPQQQVEGIRVPPSDHLVWDTEKLLLGAIREVKGHPDADRLVLAMVDYGGEELEQCVTGAPNLFTYKDLGELETPVWTAFAMEGATVWDGHSDEPKLMTLKGKKLRGIYNKSMVCSEKELGISEAHEGVILMEHDDSYIAGTPLVDVLGDVVLDIELTPNLGHNFSILGVAREVAALLGKELREPNYDFVAEGAPIEGQAAIEIRVPELNPRFTLTLLKNTKIQPSPFWMQHRLKLVGQRPINNVVDVTNYITFELGQPLHAFDYDVLVKRAGDKAPTIITRLPEEGETLETLDGAERKLGEQQILVTDTKGVLSLGGIMGGGESEISDETTNVLLEAANWHFINIRKTAQAQKLFTEAGIRFSRNVHPSRAVLGVSRGIELMRQTGGGEIAQGIIDEYALPAEPVTVDLPIERVEAKLGYPVSVQEATDVLTRLQFDVTLEGDVLHVTVPDYRTDISGGIIGQADLIEELARIIGYDRIPNTIMADAMPDQREDMAFVLEERIRDLLVTLGLRENISYRFTTPESEARLTPQGAQSSLPEGGYVKMLNPVSADKAVLRHSLLTAMLENAASNARYQVRQRVFEIGAIFLQRDDELPDELPRLAMVLTGARRDATWQGDEATGVLDFYDIKGIVEGLLGGLHVDGTRYERTSHSSLHPGRAADLFVGKKLLGSFGELHPQVAQAFRLGDVPVMVAEFDLEALMSVVPERFLVTALPVTPAILEDIAVVVPESMSHADVEATIRKAGGNLLKDVVLFDVYRGESVEAGHKSLAYALTYQTDERTLKDKDVKKVRNKIIATLDRQLGAKLRA